MRRTRQTRGGLALALVALAASACAHGAPARPPPPPVEWPAAPSPPRLRLAAVYPDPAAPPARRGFGFRAIVDALAGVDRRDGRAAGLARPFGVAADGQGGFVVADPDAGRVVRVTAAGAAEDVRCRKRPWSAPMAVAVAPDATLYVADGAAGEIVRVDRDGRCRALGSGALERPTGIAVTADRLYVADPPRHQVVVLSTAGEPLARIGTLGADAGQLHFPTAVALAIDGTLLVVDALNFRIARFAPDGAWLGAFGEAGEAGGALARPKAVAVDEGGRIYVSDAQRDLVLVYGADGRFAYAAGASGAAPGHFALPAGVAAAGGRLVVADSHNGRVQTFELLGDPR